MDDSHNKPQSDQNSAPSVSVNSDETPNPRRIKAPDAQRPQAPEPKTFRSRTGQVPKYSEKWATGRYESAPEKTASQEG